MLSMSTTPFSIYRFIDNQFKMSNLEILKELNDKRFHEIPQKLQRQLKTHTLRCIVITNESHPEIKFDVFERLNSNTVPLNAQELRNCIYRGTLNSLLQTVVAYKPWLNILGKSKADVRMRDEELVLRFFAFSCPRCRFVSHSSKALVERCGKSRKNIYARTNQCATG